MRLFKKTNIDFLGKRKMFFIISAISVVIGVVSLLTKGINYGTDFLGGTELVLHFSQVPEVSEIRTTLLDAGYNRAEIKTYGDPSRILVRTPETGVGTSVGENIIASLSKTYGAKTPPTTISIMGQQKIGPKIGAELRRNALLAVFASFVAMLIYIGIRYKFVYGMGAIVALFHDIMATLGLVSLVAGLTPWTNFEMDQNMVAAFLTLVGLSMNDTVVIFDRIRENQKIHRSMSLQDVMNKSLNETLSRTVITSGIVFVVCFILFLFGGEVNRGFGFILSFGIITGTYSSIYVASAAVLEYANYKMARGAKEGSVLKAQKSAELVK